MRKKPSSNAGSESWRDDSRSVGSAGHQELDGGGGQDDQAGDEGGDDEVAGAHRGNHRPALPDQSKGRSRINPSARASRQTCPMDRRSDNGRVSLAKRVERVASTRYAIVFAVSSGSTLLCND